MIHWLVQSTAAHPDLARGQPPLGLLSAAELARFDAMRSPKRRHDWLLGRWTAKHLVQRFLLATTHQTAPLATIEIKNEDDGSPFVELRDATGIPGDGSDGSNGSNGSNESSGRLPVCLTISHCEEWALCAVIALDSRQATSGPAASAGQAPPAIGVDIERVRPRDWNFVETFFTEAEIRQVQTAPPAWRDTLITAIWSAKEAALKVVKLGLTVDTRRVDCVCNLDRAPDDDWLPLQVTYHPATAAAAEIMPGWWTTRDGFVLTLAFSQNMA